MIRELNPETQNQAPRLAGLVADDLRRRIVSGALKDGAHLPTQAALVREFGVSLPPIREALRVLEAEGLIQVQRGKRGGAVVRRPTVATAAYAIATVLESEGVELPDVAGGLAAIEPVCLELAAARADRMETVVPTLWRIHYETVEAIDDPPTYRARSHALHEEFVKASGSKTLILLVGALESLWAAHAEELASSRPGGEDAVGREVREFHIQAHRKIIDALVAGDTVAVRRLSQEHLCEATRYSLGEAEEGGTPVKSLLTAPGRFARPLGKRSDV